MLVALFGVLLCLALAGLSYVSLKQARLVKKLQAEIEKLHASAAETTALYVRASRQIAGLDAKKHELKIVAKSNAPRTWTDAVRMGEKKMETKPE